jgi:putative peptidoglycan lipid II flippase
MNLAFIGPLKHAGLSLSIGLAACLNAALLYWQLRKQDIFQPQPGWFSFLTRLLIAVCVMAAALLGILQVMPAWEEGQMWWRLIRLAAVCAIGGGSYFVMLGLLGFRPRDFARRTMA